MAKISSSQGGRVDPFSWSTLPITQDVMEENYNYERHNECVFLLFGII